RMLEAVTRAWRSDDHAFRVGMRIDNEPEIGRNRVKTRHRLEAAIAHARDIRSDEGVVHRYFFFVAHRSVDGSRGRRGFVLLCGNLHSAARSVDRRKAVDPLLAALQLPDE